jgi:hypothetical protein
MNSQNQKLETDEEKFERELIEWSDELSHRHTLLRTSLEYKFYWLFKETDKLSDGTTKEQVANMTELQKIELLERLNKSIDMFGLSKDDLR